ncbi:MAG: hypothetical protein NZ879_03675 [Archaeoglobaceae archaeon]|nr:hypothetical protein [Archaeoglobaceae archaeon]MDW8118065.1 CARDB domain-containing protein [Archaeoglobaceae archaeon]
MLDIIIVMRLMNTKAVSPLIGFILLMAIVMGLIGILQSTALPQWNRAVESEHLSSLKYEISSMGEILSMSASTGNPAKVVLKAGVDYPNYYILISPPKASSTISARYLAVKINGTFTLNDTTSAIIVEPSYFYSSRLKFIYEHSATLRLENGFVLEESNQSTFMDDSISIYILRTNFNSFATTETANLVLTPVSIGGRSIFSGNITLECYDEKTAEWWNGTLNKIYKDTNVKVSRSGNFIEIKNLSSITLSISVFEVYALTSGEILTNPSLEGLNLIPISPLSLNVNRNSMIPIGVRVNSTYGSVKNTPVSITDSCSGKSIVLFSNDLGEVWYTFYANCTGLHTVTFSTKTSSLNFTLEITQQSGGGGGTFTLAWYNESSETSSETWQCDHYTCERDFLLNVKYQNSNVQGALVNFATNNNIVRIISSNTTYSDSNGNAVVRIQARNTTLGMSYLIGIVGDTVKVLPINVITTLLFPDLNITELTVEPLPIILGQQASIKARIANIGDANAGTFNVVFLVNGVEIANQSVSGLSHGTDTVLTTTWTPTSAIAYTIRVIADPNNAIREKNEGNNESSITVGVNAPDLTVESISLNRTPVLGQPVRIDAKIKNIGDVNAGAFSVAFYVNTTLIRTETLSGLNAGSQATVNATWIPNAVGTYLVRVIADPNNSIIESNEANNESSTTTTVTAPDLRVASITFNRTQIVVNQPVMINATVENIGNANAGAFNVRFYVNNILLDTKRVSLNAGASTILSTTWTPQSAMTYTIRVVADADAEIMESNEANNESSTTVTVGYYTLTLTVCGRQTSWSVNVIPPNADCYASTFGTTCRYEYSASTNVTLTAQPQGNFIGWSGDCTGTSNTCNLIMNSDKNVYATFSGCRVSPPITIEPPIIPPQPPPEIQ